MARNIFMVTLNSIRSSMKPAGRDVAEALDAVDAEVGALKAQIAKVKAAIPGPSTTTNVTTGGSDQPPVPKQYVPPSTPVTPPTPENVTKVYGSYTMAGSDAEIWVYATYPCTIRLSSTTEAQSVVVKNYSASGIVITIVDANGGKVDNTANIQMEWQNTSATFGYDGSGNWAIN